MHLKQSLLLYTQSLHDGTPAPHHLTSTIHEYFLNLIASNSDDANLRVLEYDPVLNYICNATSDISVTRHHLGKLFAAESVIYKELVSIACIMITHMHLVTNQHLLRQMVDAFLRQVKSSVISGPDGTAMKIFLKLYVRCEEMGRDVTEERKSIIMLFLKRMLCELRSPYAPQTISLHAPNYNEWNHRLQCLTVLMKRYKDGSFERLLFECMSHLSDENPSTCQISNVCHIIETILRVGLIDEDFRSMMLWFVLSLCQREKKSDYVHDLHRILQHCDSKTSTEFCQEIIQMMKFDPVCQDASSMRMMFTVIGVLKEHGGTRFYHDLMQETFEHLKQKEESK